MQTSPAPLGINWWWDYASWCLGQNLAVAGTLFAVRRDAYSRGYTKGHMNGYQRGYTRGQLEGRIDEWENHPTVYTRKG